MQFRDPHRTILLLAASIPAGWCYGLFTYAAGMSSVAFVLLGWMIVPPVFAFIDRRRPFFPCFLFFTAALAANQLRQFDFYRDHSFNIDKELAKHWPMWVIYGGISLCACAWGSLVAWALRRRASANPV